MKQHSKFKKELLKKPRIRRFYDELRFEFLVIAFLHEIADALDAKLKISVSVK